MKSNVIKEIRSLDKDLRESVNKWPLFRVNFKLLRDLDEDKVLEIRDWYVSLKETSAYRDLVKLLKENKPEYWTRIQLLFPNLPEYRKLQYRLQIFVAEARRTMPTEIKHVRNHNDKCNSDS